MSRASIREAEAALHVTRKEVFESERKVAVKLRKSVVFARDLPAGHILAEADLTVKCPGHGVSPIHWDDIVGRTLLSAVRHEDLVQWDQLAPVARRHSAMLEEMPLVQSRI